VIRSTPNGPALKSTDAGGLELRNLEFSNGGSYASNLASGIELQVDQSSSAGFTHFRHIRIDNVISHGFHRSGLAVFAAADVGYEDFQVTNSQFFGNQFAGIDISAANWTEVIHQDIRIDNVIAHDNSGFSGCSPHCGHGIVLGQVDGAIVENSIAQPARGTLAFGRGSPTMFA
jgi:hypothetical protein